jgi:tetratricopeptide (TPR) repeat protein
MKRVQNIFTQICYWLVALFLLGNGGRLPAAETAETKPETTAAEPTVTTNDVAETKINVTQAATATGGLTNDNPVFVPPTQLDQFNYFLSQARFAASTRDFPTAEKNFVRLLAENVPEDMNKTALFELALAVHAQNDLPRAQAILTQYLQRWPGDEHTPEIYLHQGQIFRQMGMHNFALSKFYGVMTTALSLKSDKMAFYKRLVLQAQVEIAETHYLMGRFKDAADYYGRLLAQNDPALDRAEIQFRLIRSLGALQRYEEMAQQAHDFLAHFKDSPEEPEVRYHLAQALKGEGRGSEALQQVMIFLKDQRERTKDRPEVWAYWQQRVGNEIGNQLYQDGDYVKALEVYLTLAKLDASPAWQLPVRYQVGIIYEKLLQPQLAAEAYRNITNTLPQLGTNLPPSLHAVLEMAQWRLNSLEWQARADTFNHPTGLPVDSRTNLNLSTQ